MHGLAGRYDNQSLRRHSEWETERRFLARLIEAFRLEAGRTDGIAALRWDGFSKRLEPYSEAAAEDE